MKSILTRPIFLLSLLAACQKNANNPGNRNTGNGGRNNNGGGGGGDSISVTGHSPANPYTSDIVTITGTGFKQDKRQRFFSQ